MLGFYKLGGRLGREPIACSLLEGAEWRERALQVPVGMPGSCIVAQSNLGHVEVSTVFLGVDQRFIGKGPPILFETMIFGMTMNLACRRCCTWEQAERQHEEMINAVRQAVASA